MKNLRYVLFLAAAAVIGVILAVGLSRLGDLQDRADQDRDDRADLRVIVTDQGSSLAEQEQAIEEANRRLIDAGKRPVEAPDVEDVPVALPGDGATGATGATGLAGASVVGPQGPTGPRGPRGFIGPVGESITGADGANGATGANGSDGATGESGATGQPGADSTVPGPQGPAGPAGPAGPPGKDGSNGSNGSDGKNGTAQPGTYTCADGQYVAGFTVTDSGGVQLDCRTNTPGNSSPPGQTP